MLPCGTQTSEVIGQDFFLTPMFIVTCSGFTCSLYAQGDQYGNIRQVAGGSDDNLSEKMHGGSVTDHSHAQHVANHGAPPYPDPLCSDGAPSDSLQSLLSGHGPPRKHVNFSHPN
jgi:hypothetical protein